MKIKNVVIIFCFVAAYCTFVHPMDGDLAQQVNQLNINDDDDPFATIPVFDFDYQRPKKLVASIRTILKANNIQSINSEELIMLAKALSKTGIDLGRSHDSCHNQIPLHIAAAEGDALVTQVLLIAMAKKYYFSLNRGKSSDTHDRARLIAKVPEPCTIVNSIDDNGNTPLHYVALAPKASNYKLVAELLIARNANIHAINKFRQTPTHLAAKYEKDDLVSLFKQRHHTI